MLSDDGKIIIEVGLNESVTTATHPRVPCTRAAVSADVVACAAAGAAVVHFHARNDDESNAWTDDDFYREVMDVVAAESDVLTYPTYLNGDFSAVWRLDDEPGTLSKLAIAPFDVIQDVGLMVWDEAAVDFASLGFTALGSENRLHPAPLEEMRRRGLNPTISAFDLGQSRWAHLAARAGLVDGPLNMKLFLCGTWVLGPVPDPEAIDGHLGQFSDDVDIEPTVVPYSMTDAGEVDRVLEAALDRGLNIRVGIGDNPTAHPESTNAELVDRVVERVVAHGFTPATPSDVRDRFRLKA